MFPVFNVTDIKEVDACSQCVMLYNIKVFDISFYGIMLTIRLVGLEMQKTDYMVFAGRQYFLGDKCQVRGSSTVS